MSIDSKEENTPPNALERMEQAVEYIEKLITATGEHPECELKLKWERKLKHQKAEFIRDIQSVANSGISAGKEKYIVVGVNETTRVIEGCNHDEFDDADIRQLLSTYLDAVPDFEIFRPISTSKQQFVIVIFPHQTKSPFVVKKALCENHKVHLQEGEIWFKPQGSSGKRRVISKTDILEMIDINSLVQKEVNYRLSELTTEIRNEERARIGHSSFGAVPALTSTDEEFEIYVEQLIIRNDNPRFNILIEKLRDNCVNYWRDRAESSEPLLPEEMEMIKSSIFLPALLRLVLLGILIIKYNGDLAWFTKIADLLFDVFNLHKELSLILGQVNNEKPESLKSHLNFSVPSLEALLASYLLIGYEITKKDDVKYSSTFFPRLVSVKDSSNDNDFRMFFLFFEYHYFSINKYMDVLIDERYRNTGKIFSLWGGSEPMKNGILQANFLIDWHSFLSFQEIENRKAGESETVKYFKDKYPNVSAALQPKYTHEGLRRVLPLAEKIWLDLPYCKKNLYLLDSVLTSILMTFTLEKRQEIFVRFLYEAEIQHSQYQNRFNQFAFPFYWNKEIEILKESIKKAIMEKRLQSRNI